MGKPLHEDVRRVRENLFESTSFTMKEIAYLTGASEGAARTWLCKNYSQEYRTKRKHSSYKRLTPPVPASGEKHHNYKGVISDGKGYSLILKPVWFTGRKGCKHVFHHHKVYCEHNDMTEIQKGYHVHHINGVKTDNHIDNLQLIEAGEHTRLHKNVANVSHSKED